MVNAEVSPTVNSKKGIKDMENKNNKKALGIVVNVIVIAILVLVGLITLSIILSTGKGYTNLFGNAYVAVQSDSMEGTDELYEGAYAGYEVKGFKKGDMIRVKILNDEQKKELQVGDVITFYQTVQGERVLNTHRIIEADYENGKYTTKGDKAVVDGKDATETVVYQSIVGQYKGHRLAGLGNVSDFFHSSTGFFVCVVLPSMLIVAYFAVNLVVTVKSVKKSIVAKTKEEEEAEMREKILQELRAQGKINEESAEEPPEEKPEDNTNGEA